MAQRTAALAESSSSPTDYRARYLVFLERNGVPTRQTVTEDSRTTITYDAAKGGLPGPIPSGAVFVARGVSRKERRKDAASKRRQMRKSGFRLLAELTAGCPNRPWNVMERRAALAA